MESYDYIVYAEGGYNSDLKKGAIAYIITDGKDKHIINSVSKPMNSVNDQQAHLTAIGAAVRSLPNECSVLVYSDCSYAVGLYSGTFKKVKANLDYRNAFVRLVQMKKLRFKIEWHGLKLNDPLTRLCWQGCSEEVGEDFGSYYDRKRK